MKVNQAISAAFTAIFMLTGALSWAGEWRAFDKQAFETAQQQGKTVVLDFHADWCTTCKKQQPILESLVNEPKYSSIAAFKVNFDNAGELKKRLNVQKQSTLVVFKGSKEVARNMGASDRKEIESLFDKGI